MESNIKHRKCPHCGARAHSNQEADHLHAAVHWVRDGMQHGSLLMLGSGLFAAGMHVFKKYRYTCSKCGHEFFSF
jgi:hypothetical protein